MGDPDYVNCGRLLASLERSINSAAQWAGVEPNGSRWRKWLRQIFR